MKKIPTLFKRNPEDMKHVLPEVTPGCEWVLDGQGIATRKWDGTCVLIRRDGLAVRAFARREVKRGKQPPPNFNELEHDEVTGKTVGWEPAEQSGYAKYIEEAINSVAYARHGGPTPGTYELCGPKVNGNPEGFDRHLLLRHGTREVDFTLESGAPQAAFIACKAFFSTFPHEGIVWHHPDGRMAKLKVRDFPFDSFDVKAAIEAGDDGDLRGQIFRDDPEY